MIGLRTAFAKLAGSSPQAAANMRGIAAMLFAQAIFVGSDTLIKLAGNELAASQILGVRGIMAMILMVGFIVATTGFAEIRLALRPLVLLRSLLEATLALMFVVALPHLTLGDITTIGLTTPLIITAITPFALAEHVGWRRWSAVVIGFIGVMLVMQPGETGINPYAVLALGVAVLVAIRDLITRVIGFAVPAVFVSLVTTVAVCLIGWIASPFETWNPLSTKAVVLLVASAVLVSTANVFMVRAFRGVEVSVVSPFRYFAVVWAVIFGFIVWGDVPNALGVMGTLIIIASGLYIMHRETLSRHARARAQQAD
jgi:drug/metabolite transporter (DMT)-like permease